MFGEDLKVESIKSDRYKISLLLSKELDEDKRLLKVAILSSLKTDLKGEINKGLNIQQLSIVDLFVEKIEANIDRGLDKTSYCKDIIDIGMLIGKFEKIPELSWEKLLKTNSKDDVIKSFKGNIKLLSDGLFFDHCLKILKVESHNFEKVKSTVFKNILKTIKENIPKEEFKAFQDEIADLIQYRKENNISNIPKSLSFKI